MTENLTWSASKHDEIIKRLMSGIGQPNSQSLYGAFKQFANELCALNAVAPSGNMPDLLDGLDERLDRLCVSDDVGDRFVIGTKSAKNIVGIVREWIRGKSGAPPARSAASTDGPEPVPYEKHEAEMLKIIDEREAAQSCIDDIYFNIIGRAPEWSNLFGFKDAVDEITDTVASFIAGKMPDECSTAMTDDEAMRRLSASEVACYRWPDDTVIHKALRNAFMDGAALSSAPVAGEWPKPIDTAPPDADELLLVSFQDQGPNGLIYVSMNNGCWDEAQKCFVLGPRGCSTNAVGDGHSTHWLPRSWLPHPSASRKEGNTP